jgi:hypothetical protein
MCVQEEERIKAANGDNLNYDKDNKRKNKCQCQLSFKGKWQSTYAIATSTEKPPVNKDQCNYYRKEGHYNKEYPDFLKMIMAKNGENIIIFVNESLYVQYSKSTWWIDSGETVHVANYLQGFCSTRTTQRNKRHMKVTNGG